MESVFEVQSEQKDKAKVIFQEQARDKNLDYDGK